MKTHDRAEFAKILAALGELYRRPLSEAVASLYWRALARFDIGDIVYAVNAHVQNPDKGCFMPQPADLILYLEGNAAIQSARAWAKVYKAIKQVGPYYSVVFDDALIHVALIDLGGWVKICQMKEADAPFRAREFEKYYAGYLISKPSHYPKQLVGLAELANNCNKLMALRPMLVGDPEAALKVYLSGQATAPFLPVRPLGTGQQSQRPFNMMIA